MKKIYRLIFPIITILSYGTLVSAQNDDTIEFEPIHSTLLPSYGTFTIEDRYDKNSSVFFVGDELMLQSNKMETADALFTLPINSSEDFAVEFSFNSPSLKNSMVSIGTNDFALTIGYKTNIIVLLNKQQGQRDQNENLSKLKKKMTLFSINGSIFSNMQQVYNCKYA